MDPRLPTCRYFIVCTDGRATVAGEPVRLSDPDSGVVEVADPTGGRLVLLHPVHALRPPRPYPAIVPNLYLYAHLSNGSGRHALAIELRRWYRGEPFRVFRSPQTWIDFGTDRADVRAFQVRLAPVIFPTAAQYTLRLLCDGTEDEGGEEGNELAQAHLELLDPL